MILPCRIHRARNRNRVDSLPLALVLVTCLFAPVREAISQDAVAGASEAAGVSWLPAVPIQITAGVDIGLRRPRHREHCYHELKRSKAHFSREKTLSSLMIAPGADTS